ncbi:MAG: hypothetical protein LBU39_09510 [Desulfobulbaceae bacterium]|jgi:hypothetical protein|nr:hypothetical protein [Desulfobulbaceae bacterium]
MAMTDDYADVILRYYGKDDKRNIPLALEKRANEWRQLETAANQAMKAIEDALPLRAMDDADLRKAHETLRKIHGQAFNWDPPTLSDDLIQPSETARWHVRRWIWLWDMGLLKLRPDDFNWKSKPKKKDDYEEDPDIEHGVEEQ